MFLLDMTVNFIFLIGSAVETAPVQDASMLSQEKTLKTSHIRINNCTNTLLKSLLSYLSIQINVSDSSLNSNWQKGKKASFC